MTDSGCFDRIILSSGDGEIRACGSQIKGVTSENRDERFAGDKIKVIDLIKSIAARDGYVERVD